MAKRLSILNLLSVILSLFVSYYTQAIELNGNTMNSLSQEYYNLFTPADYAFSIWGLIFLSLLGMGIYQVYQAYGPRDNLDFLLKSGYWFFIANIANACWVVLWFYEYTGFSIIIMLLILFSLIKIILNTNMERWDAPLKVIATGWWPISFYSGWIAVATIANISAYLAKINWRAWFFSEVQWTLAMIGVTTIINVIIIYTRNMREFATVGVWALVAIFVRHLGENTVIAYAALAGAILIFLNAAYHAFINRKTNPMYRMMNNN